MKENKVVGGLNVHKDNVYLCIIDSECNILFEAKFKSFTDKLQEMTELMVSYGVSEVAMESTSTYWMPVWNVVGEVIPCKLANPQFIKQLPGRKSDIADARWIAECLLKELIRGSFVPSPVIQDMRLYDRQIYNLNRECISAINTIENTMHAQGFRLSDFVKIDSVSYQKVIQKVITGMTDPSVLINEIHTRTRKRVGDDDLISSMTANFSMAGINVIRAAKERYDFLVKQKDEMQRYLTEMCEQAFKEELELLEQVPGVQERAATSIIANTGLSMDAFQTAEDITSWAGLCPRNDISNGHYKSKKTTHGNKFLRMILIQCAWAATRNSKCYFSRYYFTQTQVKHKPAKKVLVAVARKILVAIWHMVKKGEPYKDYAGYKPKDAA